MYFKNTNILLSCLLIILTATPIFASALQEFKEVIEREFQFSVEDPDILISNRYGNVDITPSSSNTAEIEVTIIVEARNKENANRILDKIDINFSDTDRSLKAITSINNKDGWNLTKNNESYQVHYLIKLPKTSSLSVENKYGNIAIAELNNDLDVELKYGNAHVQDINGDISLELGHVDKFLLGNVSGDASLEIQYSKLSMKNVQDIEIESKYSEIRINNAVSIDSETKNTDITINKTGKFTNDGKYDEIDIGIVGEVSFDTKYTDIDIGTMHETGLFYLAYGQVSIDEVTAGFDEIEIESKNTNFQIAVKGGYELKVEGKYTGVSYPDDMDLDYRDKDKNELKIKGNQPGAGNGKIHAEMKYGKLRIRD